MASNQIDEGVLVRDEVDCFYIYRLRMGDHVQHGIVAGFSVQEYEDDLIKKHELTRREKEDDRARHVERLMANAGPVLLTHKNTPALQALVARITAAEPTSGYTQLDMDTAMSPGTVEAALRGAGAFFLVCAIAICPYD